MCYKLHILYTSLSIFYNSLWRGEGGRPSNIQFIANNLWDRKQCITAYPLFYILVHSQISQLRSHPNIPTSIKSTTMMNSMLICGLITNENHQLERNHTRTISPRQTNSDRSSSKKTRTTCSRKPNRNRQLRPTKKNHQLHQSKPNQNLIPGKT